VAFILPLSKKTMTLKTGDKIPHFTLPDQAGNLFNIETLLTKKSLVIYFYPKDETAGCTKQACAFRDNYQDFKEAGAEVIGISSDSEASHENFAIHHKLPFILLSDTEGTVRTQFGVPTDLLGLLPGRVTYIIDKQGVIKYIFNSQVRIGKHISESLRILQGLN
jgi:thioredoxin-dependent peroxiredoxin